MRVLIRRGGVFGLGIGQGGGGVAAGLAEPVEVEALHEGRSLLIMTERKLTSTLHSPATRSARTRAEIPSPWLPIVIERLAARRLILQCISRPSLNFDCAESSQLAS
jgi:hypothetical protein